MAQTNLKNARRGVTPEYPDTVDIVITSKIIQARSRREANPNYKASTKNENNFGKQLLNSLGSRNFRYYLVSNVDVEVGFVVPKTNRQVTHIERLEYRVPLTDNVNQQQLQAEVPVTASVDAVQAAMVKFDLPVTAAENDQQLQEQEEPKNIFNELFKLPRQN